MDKLQQSAEKLLDNCDKALYLKMLEKGIHQYIPFNIPHKFSFKKLTDKTCKVYLKNRRYNRNHLGRIHACAIATAGELPAGLVLIKNFKFSEYRLIMSEINVVYRKQAKKFISATSDLTAKQIEQLKIDLEKQGKALIEMKTEIYESELHIATVSTKWQLKSWKNVSQI